MDTITVLTLARDKIADHSHWRQGAAHSTKSVDTFCAEEAIESIAGHLGPDRDLAVRALEDIVGEDPFIWNDRSTRTHADVLEAFDCAIRALRLRS